MNKVYKLVWSKAKNMYVAVAEFAKSHTKASTGGIVSRALTLGVLLSVLSCGAVMPVSAMEVVDEDDIVKAHQASNYQASYYYHADYLSDYILDGTVLPSSFIDNLLNFLNLNPEEYVGYLRNGDGIIIRRFLDKDNNFVYTATLAGGEGDKYLYKTILLSSSELPSEALNYIDRNYNKYTYNLDNFRQYNESSITLGLGSKAMFDKSIAVGNNDIVRGTGAVAIGNDIVYSELPSETGTSYPNPGRRISYEEDSSVGSAKTTDSIAIGNNIRVREEKTVGIGQDVLTRGYKGIAIGSGSSSNSEKAIALGSDSNGLGDLSVAIGPNSISSYKSVALGTGASAHNSRSIAIGADSQALLIPCEIESNEYVKTGSVAIGADSKALSNLSIAVGDNAVAEEGKAWAISVGANSYSGLLGAHAIGYGSKAYGKNSVALGRQAITGADTSEKVRPAPSSFVGSDETVGTNAVSVGYLALASANNAMAMGYKSTATGENAMAFGSGDINTDSDFTDSLTIASAKNSLAVGFNTKVSGEGSVAIGSNSSATGANSIVLGAGSSSVEDNVLAVGSASNRRRIVNVKEGVLSKTSTDVVTGAQLYATNQNVAGFAADIKKNKDNISNLNTSVTAALESVSSTSSLVDTLNNTKADASLNNLTAAGQRVISTAAANAVQEYMASQQGNSRNVNFRDGGNTPVSQNVSENRMLSNSLIAKRSSKSLKSSSSSSDFNPNIYYPISVDDSQFVDYGTDSHGTTESPINYNFVKAGYYIEGFSMGETGTKVTTATTYVQKPVYYDAFNFISEYPTKEQYILENYPSHLGGTPSSDLSAYTEYVNRLESMVEECGALSSNPYDLSMLRAQIQKLKNHVSDGDVRDHWDGTYGNLYQWFSNGFADTYGGVWKEFNSKYGQSVMSSMQRELDEVALSYLAEGCYDFTNKVIGITDGQVDNHIIDEWFSKVEEWASLYKADESSSYVNRSSMFYGVNNKLSGDKSLAAGKNNTVATDNSTVIGNDIIVNSNDSVVLGNNSVVNENAIGSLVLGHDSSSSAENALVLGNNASATGVDSVAIGRGSVADTDNVVSVGSADNKRKIVNVGNGEISNTSFDAVTGQQLYATNTNLAGVASDVNRNKENIRYLNESVTMALESVSSAGLLVDTVNNTKADASLNNLTAVGQQVISNAAANAVQEYMATHHGHNNTNNVDASLRMVSSVQRSVDPVNMSLMSINPAPVDTNFVVYDDTTADKIILEGANGTKITNLADGSVVFGSTDAVTGGQLYDITQQLDTKADITYVDNEVSSIRTALSSKADTSYVNNQLALKADASSVYTKTETDGLLAEKADVSYVDNGLAKKADITYVDDGLALKADKDSVYTKTEADDLFVSQKTMKDALEKKAGVDASNIDVAAWTEKLGKGTIEEGNTGLVNGGTVYEAISRINGTDMIAADYDAGAIHIAGNNKYDGFNVVDVSRSDGSGRVITGVITNPADKTSAANVGYVEAIGQQVAESLHGSISEVNDRVNKVGANAAAMASLMPPSFDGDEKWALSAAMGNYKSASAGAVGVFYRPQDNITMNLRGSFGSEENMVGGGVTVALQRGNTPGVSKAQLVRAVNAQANEIAELKAQVAEMAAIIKQQCSTTK